MPETSPTDQRIEDVARCVLSDDQGRYGESALKRAAKLEAALGEISHYGLSIPREMTEAQYNRAAMRDMMRIAAAALAETAPEEPK